MRMRQVVVPLLLLALTLAWSGLGLGAEVPRMTKEELKGRLGQAELVVIDVRAPRDWTGSQEKIAGAVREDPGAEGTWGASYPKEKTLVLYCA